MPAHGLDHRTARGLARAARLGAVLHRRGVELITFAGAVAAGVGARRAGVGHERALAGDHRRRESAETFAVGHEAERPCMLLLAGGDLPNAVVERFGAPVRARVAGLQTLLVSLVIVTGLPGGCLGPARRSSDEPNESWSRLCLTIHDGP